MIGLDGTHHPVFLYAAEETHIDQALRPYSWYKNFVVEGARQHHLPSEYITVLEGVETIEDPDQAREATNRSILC